MLKTIRYFYWVAALFIKRHIRIIFQSTLAAILLVGIIALVNRYLPMPKNTLRIGRVGKYSLETLPTDIQTKVSTGLVTVSSTGDISPGLAKSWTISPDSKTYTFTLDPRLHWQDGSPVVPADITYNFREVQGQTGTDSVSYRLSEPFAPFFTAVSRPILKDGKFGTGAYRITNTEMYSGVLESIDLTGEADRLVYKFYPTENSAITAYKLGEVDRLEDISYLPPEVKNDADSEVSPYTQDHKQAVLFFNNNDALLSSKSVRQGLAYAIHDKSFGGTRALSPIDKNSWAYNPLVKSYDFDPAHAKTLFSQDVKDLTATKIELKTILPYLDVAESIASDWQTTLGVSVDVKVVANVTSDYQALLADYTPPADPDQYTMWHSTQPTNFTHFANLKVDKLLEDGRRTLDQKLRKEIYQDFQRFLLEDCPAVFLYDSSSYSISRKPLL